MERNKGLKIQHLALGEIKLNPDNPRTIEPEQMKLLVRSVKDFPEMLELRPLVIDASGMILGGNMRFLACQEIGLETVPILRAEGLTPEQIREFIVKDNLAFGSWNWKILEADWDPQILGDWGLDIEADEKYNKWKENDAAEKDILFRKFGVPPFSILDSRQGYWMERKKSWRTILDDNGESREGTLSESEMFSATSNKGVSVFDPVLAEIILKWFCPEGGSTFDCFAGGAFGFIADKLGHKYTGIELRQEQVDLNNSRIGKNVYLCDDGRNVLQHVKPESRDLLFSCPPYYDLEVYSDSPQDASNQGSYSDFMQLIREAFTDSIKCLKPDRFAVIVVGDIRDKEGAYRRFPDDVKAIFQDSGMVLYNEMIYIEALGTLPRRATGYMQTRKVGKCHQNVLVFYKGSIKAIKDNFPPVCITELEGDENA